MSFKTLDADFYFIQSGSLILTTFFYDTTIGTLLIENSSYCKLFDKLFAGKFYRPLNMFLVISQKFIVLFYCFDYDLFYDSS